MTEHLSGAVGDAAVALPHVRVPGHGGTVAHARWDEDVVTLAVQAGLEVLERSGARPRALLTATVSSPFAEGGVGQVLAEVFDLANDGLLVQEHTGSVAATGGALAGALALTAAGMGPVLLVAADVRRDGRGRALGDAAVALLIDHEGAVAQLRHVESGATLLRDVWRRDGAATIETADRSFLKAVVPRATGEHLVDVTANGPRFERVGLPGCAGFPLALLLSLGDGRAARAATAAGGVRHVFEVEPGHAAADAAARTRAVVAAGVDGAAPAVPDVAGFDPYASQPRLFRERGQDLRLQGQRDPVTGEVLYPPVPAAVAGALDEHRLGRHGTVLTTTRDHIFPQDAPLSMAVVEVDGGGRFFGQVADGLEVTIGERVRLVLRRLHDGGGLPHWFWKIVPDDSPQSVTA